MRVGLIQCANVKMILSRLMGHVCRCAIMVDNILPVVFVVLHRSVTVENGIIKMHAVHVRQIQPQWKMGLVGTSLVDIVCVMVPEQQIRIYQVQTVCYAADAQVIQYMTVKEEHVNAITKIIHIMKRIIAVALEQVSVGVPYMMTPSSKNRLHKEI